VHRYLAIAYWRAGKPIQAKNQLSVLASLMVANWGSPRWAEKINKRADEWLASSARMLAQPPARHAAGPADSADEPFISALIDFLCPARRTPIRQPSTTPAPRVDFFA